MEQKDIMLNVRLGMWVRNARLKQGLTQKEASRKIHVSQAYLCQVEKGDKNITLKKFSDIMRNLEGNTIDYQKYFGSIIREERKRRNLTIHDFSEQNMFCDHYISEIERGIKNVSSLYLNDIFHSLSRMNT